MIRGCCLCGGVRFEIEITDALPRLPKAELEEARRREAQSRPKRLR